MIGLMLGGCLLVAVCRVRCTGERCSARRILPVSASLHTLESTGVEIFCVSGVLSVTMWLCELFLSRSVHVLSFSLIEPLVIELSSLVIFSPCRQGSADERSRVSSVERVRIEAAESLNH